MHRRIIAIRGQHQINCTQTISRCTVSFQNEMESAEGKITAVSCHFGTYWTSSTLTETNPLKCTFLVLVSLKAFVSSFSSFSSWFASDSLALFCSDLQVCYVSIFAIDEQTNEVCRNSGNLVLYHVVISLSLDCKSEAEASWLWAKNFSQLHLIRTVTFFSALMHKLYRYFTTKEHSDGKCSNIDWWIS